MLLQKGNFKKLWELWKYSFDIPVVGYQRGSGVGGGRRGKRDQIYDGRKLALGGEHRTEYTNIILQTCTPEIYIMSLPQ